MTSLTINSYNTGSKLVKNFDEVQFKYFLAGFIEGEGSLCVSIKRVPTAKYGFVLDPEFFIYQHISGLPILHAAKAYFRTGSIQKKSGSTDVYQFYIGNRIALVEKVIPYFKKYVLPFSCKFSDFHLFEKIVLDLQAKKHSDLTHFFDLLQLTYQLNPTSKGKKRKYTLDTIHNIILRDYTPNVQS